jgi:hypothetical protein
VQVKVLDDVVDELVHELVLVQHLANEFVKRTREDSEKQQRTDRNSSAARHAKALQEAGQLRAQLVKLRAEYWANEAAARKVS